MTIDEIRLAKGGHASPEAGMCLLDAAASRASALALFDRMIGAPAA